jgi:hypothetical protein
VVAGRNRIGLALGLALSVAASTAAAFPAARLVYVRGQGAEGCPGEMDLRLSVAHRLGYDPFATGSRRTIIAVVERDGEGLTARLELVDEQGVSQGERRMEAPADRCDDLVRALALSMSIAIDPEHTETDPEAPSAWRFSEPDARESTRTDGPRPRARKRKAEERAPIFWRVGLGAQAALGVAPAPVGGLLAVFSPRYRNVSLALEFRMDASASRKLANGSTIESQLVGGSVAPCFHHDPGYLCALGTLGTLDASSDAANGKSDSALFGAAGLRLGTEWRLSPALVFRTHADVLATLTPVHIELDDLPVWESAPVSGSLGMALLARFP